MSRCQGQRLQCDVLGPQCCRHCMPFLALSRPREPVTAYQRLVNVSPGKTLRQEQHCILCQADGNPGLARTITRRSDKRMAPRSKVIPSAEAKVIQYTDNVPGPLLPYTPIQVFHRLLKQKKMIMSSEMESKHCWNVNKTGYSNNKNTRRERHNWDTCDPPALSSLQEQEQSGCLLQVKVSFLTPKSSAQVKEVSISNPVHTTA